MAVPMLLALRSIICFACTVSRASAFVPQKRSPCSVRERHTVSLERPRSGGTDKETSTYESSDSSSKGIVSSLTGLVNFVMGSSDDARRIEDPAPSTAEQLLEKIRDDYVVNNYLWTGDIYLPAFDEKCRYTDPTLSFVGRDKFVSNVQNLRPIVDFLSENGKCESNLLDISLNQEDGYIQSRWNMVGELNRLPWKPKIDVIGRTKFWYREVEGRTSATNGNDGGTAGFRVFFYDEEWEIPAGQALLQLVTSAGTISNQPE